MSDEHESMSIDEVLKDMEAFDKEGAEWMTPVAYAKLRPVYAPQVYGWIRKGWINWKRCDCGRVIISVEDTDELLRKKGKLPKLGDEDPDG